MLTTRGMGPGPLLPTFGLGVSAVSILVVTPGVTFVVDPGTFQFLVEAGCFTFLALVGLPFSFKVFNMSQNTYKVREPGVTFKVPADDFKFVVPARGPEVGKAR